MNKRAAIVIWVIVVLVIMIYISMKLSKPSIEKQKQILANAEIVLVHGDNEIIMNIHDISNITEENFQAVLDTSSTNPVIYNYTGVQLKNIFKKYDINLDDKKSVILSAVDGYAVVYSIEEIILDKNVYITYKQDDNYLGTKEKGGRGPYESIIVSDQFSNRRCKWLTKIEVK